MAQWGDFYIARFHAILVQCVGDGSRRSGEIFTLRDSMRFLFNVLETVRGAVGRFLYCAIPCDSCSMEYTTTESLEPQGVEEAGCKIYSGAPTVNQDR